MTSREVAWWTVYELVADQLGNQPTVIAGTPAWQHLSDDDPDKWAAVLWAAVWWCLDTDIKQEHLAAASREIAAAGNWSPLASRVRCGRGTAYIPRESKSAWAVLGAVLLRVLAAVGEHVQLPGVIGGRASLNLGIVFVGASGAGKGNSDKVAREAWPTPVIERPLGSGEGIAALFQPPKKEGAERITRAIFTVPEVDTLTGIAARQGSILLAQLKSALMGELIGQSNASEATSRVVQAHSYRCCLSIGAQPGHAAVIFGDTSGGTPQRLLWLPTTDPTMPAERTPDPEPLNHRLPGLLTRVHDDPSIVTEIIYGTSDIAETILTAHLARQRGEGDALDGHALLTRCKVAAGLAIMRHGEVIGAEEWELSAVIMQKSDATRAGMIEYAKNAARAKVRERAQARAAGEDFYDASRLETVKRSLLRMLERDGEQSAGDLRRRLGKREKRELFEQAIDLLESGGLVSSRPGEHNGVRYRIGSPVTNRVTPQKRRSDWVTEVVTGDHIATHANSDSPSSHDSETDPPANPPPDDEPEPAPMNRPRHTACKVCYITLPAAASTDLCDDCTDGPVVRREPNDAELQRQAETNALREKITQTAAENHRRAWDQRLDRHRSKRGR